LNVIAYIKNRERWVSTLSTCICVHYIIPGCCMILENVPLCRMQERQRESKTIWQKPLAQISLFSFPNNLHYKSICLHEGTRNGSHANFHSHLHSKPDLHNYQTTIHPSTSFYSSSCGLQESIVFTNLNLCSLPLLGFDLLSHFLMVCRV